MRRIAVSVPAVEDLNVRRENIPCALYPYGESTVRLVKHWNEMVVGLIREGPTMQPSTLRRFRRRHIQNWLWLTVLALAGGALLRPTSLFQNKFLDAGGDFLTLAVGIGLGWRYLRTHTRKGSRGDELALP